MIGLNIPTFTDPTTGLVCINAFANIESFFGNTEETTFLVSFYASPERLYRSFCVLSYSMPTSDVLSGTPINTVYQYLQTLPDFTNSVILTF